MNKTNKLFLTGAIATLSTGLAIAQTTPSTTRPNDADSPSRVQADLNRPAAVATDETSVTKINKASGLIGMDVRNQQDERLGEIKDLVVDLQSGKIAYAVLSVGGFLGIGDKLVAVPPSAFSMAPDQERLVLNADKARIQNSPGFAKNAWPDLHSPDWTRDSQYWLSDTAQGTLGTTRTGTGLGSDAARIQSETRSGSDTLRPLDRPTTDVDRSSTDRLNERRDADRRDVNRLDNDRLDVDRSSDRNTFQGRITAVDPEKRTMTVQGPSGTRNFDFTDRPTITLKDNRNPRLTDLKVGYPVSVGFHQENDKYVAHSVTRTDSPEVK